MKHVRSESRPSPRGDLPAAPRQPRRAPRRLALWGLALLWPIGLLPVGSAAWPAAPATDKGEDALQQLLGRLGLLDLQILHLEQRLATPAPGGSAEPLARELADLYAARLMDSANDRDLYDITMSHIQELIQRFPHANTSALQVMLLQADYHRAETQIGTWIADPQNSTARQEAESILQRIAPRLDTLQQQLNQQVEQILNRMDQLPEGDAMQAAEQQLRRTQPLAVRTAYFAAWAHYYLGTVTGAAAGSEPFQLARQTFRRVLGVEDQQLREIRPRELGLETVWRARALTGLGLSEAACGNGDECDAAFALLEDVSVAAEIRDQAPYWYLRALTGSGRWAAAVDFARSHLRRFGNSATQGQVSFSAALVRIGYAPPAERPAEAREPCRELGKLGLAGLARLGQFAALEQLVQQLDVPVDAQAGFVLLWARGQKQFAAAEQAPDDEAYRTARDTLQAALASPDAGLLAGPAARCRYTLGWCHYRLQNDTEAAAEFNKAVAGLKTTADPLAPEAAWMSFVAYRRLAESQPRFATAAAEALQRVARAFPQHAYARRVELELARLPGGGSPEQAIQRLEAVPPSDPGYADARFELCLLWHRRWEQGRDDPQLSRPYFTALNLAVETYLQAAPNNATQNTQKIRSCLLAVEAAQHPTVQQTEVARKLLAQAQSWVATLPADNPLAAEFHYRALLVATADNEAAARLEHARWLTEQAAGSPYETAALIVLANSLDQAATSAADSQPAAQRAYDAFARLVALLGDSPETLATQKNARVALSRLAAWAERLNRPAEAADLLAKLRAAFPRERQYLRRAGLAEFRAGRPAQALPHWRALLVGLPRGSDDWYEAKYYQLRCLTQTDRPQAVRVFSQFQLLYPELGGETWSAKFNGLGLDR